MKIKRTERGWAGHFICAQDCTFKRNTLLQYGKKYIVISTVGCMRRRDSNGSYPQTPEQIGVDRYYETMSFYADDNDAIYHDANVSSEFYVPDIKWAINKEEMSVYKETIDNIANKMHEDYVSAVEKMLMNGEL